MVRIEARSILFERGVGIAHHVEKDAVFGHGVAFAVRVLQPMLRSERPRTFVAVGLSPVFGIYQQDVDAYGGLVALKQSCHFEQHAGSACAVVGSVDRMPMVVRIGIVVGPRAAIPMGEQQHAPFFFGIKFGDDVARIERCAVECF